ncbi:NADP-dependent oxidoreductase domain-containing protein [Aspergillus multicolor]|uniref:NADP-dependent oxidoreductase domain-containing protein n=1 Tax=Aspergillus multicolor TaxID=41759 RepID=UPI003CCD7C5E
MEALHDAVKSGKLLEMQYTARMNGWTEFISLQTLHNAIYREEEREMYPACAKFGMAGIPWSPVSMGFLTRPWREFASTKRGIMQKRTIAGTPYTENDKARDVSMVVVAIAWSLSKSGLKFELSEEEIKSIDDLYLPKGIMRHK